MTDLFACTGVVFAGPITYRVSKKTVGKAYLALFTCATTRAVHLKVCRDLTAEEFQRAMKEFVARRGTPKIMVSNNGKTFTATKKWLSRLKKNEELMNYLATDKIKWRFNLSRAPWWGGFFEPLIGTMKRSLAKVIGISILKFAELEEALLDIECVMNNRPLSYANATRGSAQNRGRGNASQEDGISGQKQGTAMKEVVRRILVRAGGKRAQTKWSHVEILNNGKVVLLKEDTKNRAQWRIGRVVGKVFGRDGVIRGLKIKLGNGYIVERPLQLIYNLEVGGENCAVNVQLNPKAEEFRPRESLPRKARNDEKNQMAAVKVHEDQEDLEAGY